jgi:hypothetical protein
MAVTSFTAVCRLRPGLDAETARGVLSALPVGKASPFAASARTHFARLQIVDELRVHSRRRLTYPTLIWSTDVDGDVRSYLVELLTESGNALGPVVRLCAEAPSDPSAPDFLDRAVAYLLERELAVGLQYTNSPGRSATEISRAVLRRRLLAAFALDHQRDTPSTRRAAFVAMFGPPEIDLREVIDVREPVVADLEATTADPEPVT